MIKIILYQTYLFSKLIRKDNLPFFVAILNLSFGEGLLLFFSIEYFVFRIFGLSIPNWINVLSVTILLAVFNTAYFSKKKRKKLLAEKPLLVNNQIASMLLSILFYAIGITLLFISDN